MDDEYTPFGERGAMTGVARADDECADDCGIIVPVALGAALASLALMRAAAGVAAHTMIADEVGSTLMMLLVAFSAGFVGAIAGLGGGIIIVPALTGLFGVPIKEAIAISIVGVTMTGLSGGSAYLARGLADLRLALFLESATTLGAMLGALAALSAPAWALYLMFSVAAFYTGVVQLRRALSRARIAERAGGCTRGRRILGWVLSFVAGVGAGMLGIGGGFIKVAVMSIVMGVPIRTAIATSQVMIGITGATGAAVYFARGAIRTDILPAIAIGTVAGAKVGARVMPKLPARALRAIFAALVIYIGFNMARRGILMLRG